MLSNVTDRLSHNSTWARVQDRALQVLESNERLYLPSVPTSHQVMGGWTTSIFRKEEAGDMPP